MKSRYNPLTFLFLTGVFLAISFVFAGCSTPEGGSSLPWAQPEPWEGTPVGMPLQQPS